MQVGCLILSLQFFFFNILIPPFQPTIDNDDAELSNSVENPALYKETLSSLIYSVSDDPRPADKREEKPMAVRIQWSVYLFQFLFRLSTFVVPYYFPGCSERPSRQCGYTK
jgi:hypothetical protein